MKRLLIVFLRKEFQFGESLLSISRHFLLKLLITGLLKIEASDLVAAQGCLFLKMIGRNGEPRWVLWSKMFCLGRFGVKVANEAVKFTWIWLYEGFPVEKFFRDSFCGDRMSNYERYRSSGSMVEEV